MAINFTDSPADGATQVISGKTYTYNSAKNKWDTTATEVTGPTAAVYASVDNLPTSGNITGSQAFVSGTNRLYIWNGSGWYNIALINNNPSISGVASSYDLAIDGTATTVTMVATDPEGLPITYSIASDTSGSTATVAQGTGSNTNVFTITPSTNSAHAGSFSLTFRASDGINLATAVSSFTLQFKVVNQKYTTALITSVGANNAVNNSFDDKSTSNHTITVAGNATQTTFSPYRHGGYSTYFDGSGDYLASDNNNIGNFGTGDFTIEGWIWVPDRSALYTVVDGRPTSLTSASGWSVAINTSGGMYVYSGGFHISGTNGDVTTQTWHHWALTRSSGDMKLFLNGTQQGSTNSTARDYTANLFRVGASGTGGEVFKGYQRDVRVVKGTALYTSNFTKPDEPLTAVTNTTFLGCHLPYIADGSTNDHTIAINGDPSTEPFGPYDAQEYSSSSHGGSMSLDGTGDRISAAASADFGFGTGDFTVEWWINFNSISNYPYQIDMRSADNDTPLSLFTRTNLQNQLGVYVSNSIIASGTYSFKPGIWTHYAICKTGGYLKGYMNGEEDFSISCTRDYGTSEAISIGSVYGNNNYYVNGNIADVRIVKGTAVYTAEFTPPTEPLTAVTNTKLLIQSTDAGIIDKSQCCPSITLAGNTKSSTAQTKYLTSSIYVDGTGDYILLDDSGDLHDMFAADFTIEGWYYPSTTPGNSVTAVFSKRANGSTTGGVLLYFAGADSTPSLLVDTGGSWGINSACSSGFTVGQWNHFAVTRNGSAFKVFIDGSSVLSVSSSATIPNNTAKFGIGTMGNDGSYAMPAAYFSDIRITKGLARYTSNFTAPTAALQG